MLKGPKLKVALTLVAVAGVGAAYGLYFTPQTPGELAIANTQGLFTTAEEGLGSKLGDPSGRWEVRPGSEAGYRVRTKLARLPASSDAVGRTDAVTGGLTVVGEGQDYTVNDIEIQVDLSKLESDSPRRDDALRTSGLETDRFPLARFVGKGPIALPEPTSAGRTVRMTLEGMLTIHEVTKQVSIPIEARLEGGRAEVAGSFTFPMAEFGIQPPDVANIVTVEPTGTMEFRLLLTKAA